MTSRTEFADPTGKMTRHEIREALRGVRPGMIADFMESTGWTLQETRNQADIWTKWFGGAVFEIQLPEPGTGIRDAAECPDAVEAIQKLAAWERRSQRSILQKIAPSLMGKEPVHVILEDITRTGVRRVMTEQLRDGVLTVMQQKDQGEPEQLERLLWKAHRALAEAVDLMTETEREHAGRLVERLSGEEGTK